jgi:sugar phosphate isomerase/epimerase
MENAVGILNQAHARCRELRIGLVLENMLPHLFAGKVRDLLWILGALDTIGIGICLDTGHAHLGEEVSKVAHKLSGHLWMMHASDNHGQYDDHLPPGDGKIGWANLLAHLNRLHFTGTIMLEIKNMGSPQATMEGACRGRKHLRDLSHGLRISV